MVCFHFLFSCQLLEQQGMILRQEKSQVHQFPQIYPKTQTNEEANWVQVRWTLILETNKIIINYEQIEGPKLWN